MDNLKQQGNDYEEFIKGYNIYQNNPLKVLMYLYKGNLGKIIVSILFFIIKNSPVWIIPLVTANI